MDNRFDKQPPFVPVSAKRDNERDSLFFKAILRFPATGEQGEVRIRNLSASGLMAEAPVRVSCGEKVEIELRTVGWISGNIVWATEGKLGIKFDHPINAKNARLPIGQGNIEIPHYLKKLNNQPVPKPKRHVS